MKQILRLIYFSLFSLFFLLPTYQALALEPGTILYRTTQDGKMYGYNSTELLEVKNGILNNINPGHVAIYIGEENGEHYLVEALAGGIVKTPAKYFINEGLGENLIGAKIPKEATVLDRLKAVKLAKSLVGMSLGYDFDFRKQKGPGSGDWTCVGLVEKIYESVNKLNPLDWFSLEYNPNYYGIDITPDGFDNSSVINADGDSFSRRFEFSKVARYRNILLPLPEIVGYNAGLEHNGERYIFFPYTQFVQNTLKTVPIDINLSSNFDANKIRGKTPALKILLRWSLINNPISSAKNALSQAGQSVKNYLISIFGQDKAEDMVLVEIDNDGNYAYQSEIDNLITINTQDPKQAAIDNKKKQEINNESPASQSNNSNIKINTNNTPQNNNSNNNQSGTNLSQYQSEAKLQNQVNINTGSQENQSNTNSNNNLGSNLKTESLIKINNYGEAYQDSSQGGGSAQNNSQSSGPVEYKPSEALMSKIGIGSIPKNTGSNSGANSNNNNLPKPTALISKIYATDNNDFVELYNPLDYDFDLAEASFRLERSKTAEDPSIAIRIGDDKDGYYPGGTVIKAKGYYLIVREDASDYYLNLADAIATRKEFSWTGSGYILYLGNGAISSSVDEDIVDAVGFGAAKYFQGSAPAPAMPNNYFLNRISNVHDNSVDFKLVPIADPDVVWDEDSVIIDDGSNNSGGSNNTGGNGSSDGGDNGQNDPGSGVAADDFIPFVAPTPYALSNLSYLRNFAECYSDDGLNYGVGRYDCGAELGSRYTILEENLPEEINLNQSTLGFYYRNTYDSDQFLNLEFKLSNDSGQYLGIKLSRDHIEFNGFSTIAPRADFDVFGDSDWHHLALYIDKENNELIVFLDGHELFGEYLVETLASDMNHLKISAGSYDVTSVGIDEIFMVNRSVERMELEEYVNGNAPFAPNPSREDQYPAELKYFWDFNEAHDLANEGGGPIAVDKVAGVEMDVSNNTWIWREPSNSAIKIRYPHDLEARFPRALSRKDLSLTFWWRSELPDNDGGRSRIVLKNDFMSSFGLTPALNRRSYTYNGKDRVLSYRSNDQFPFDDNWHHISLTYDSFRYSFKLYVDGELMYDLPHYWMPLANLPNQILVRNELYGVELDDIAVWEGALTPNQVKNLSQGVSPLDL